MEDKYTEYERATHQGRKICEREAQALSAPSGSALSDATKGRLSMKGQALLQWGWDGQFYDHSIQMPEKVVDEILAGRDALHNKKVDR